MIDANRLITLRNQRTLSREQLADKANLSARQIARIETATTPVAVRRTTAERLARALEVDAAMLDGTLPLPEDVEGRPSAETKIDGRCLKHLRAAKRWSRRKLAKESRVSERQIARLEAAETAVLVRATTFQRLRAALRVDAEELTGDLSPAQQPHAPPDDHGLSVDPSVIDRLRDLVQLRGTSTSRDHQVGARVGGSVRLAYDLVERRYGATAKNIVTLGPMLFVLLAEGCLARRQGKLAEVNAAKDRLESLATDDTLYFTKYLIDVDAGADVEESSIKQADIRGEVVRREGLTWGMFNEDDLFAVTPFAIYLEQLAAQIDKPNVIRFVDVDLDDFDYDDLFGADPYQCCAGELEKIAGVSERARLALLLGLVRIGEIPVDLMVESATEQRVEWLESKLDESRRQLREDNLSTGGAK